MWVFGLLYKRSFFVRGFVARLADITPLLYFFILQTGLSYEVQICEEI
jgi:hypothetical protein